MAVVTDAEVMPRIGVARHQPACEPKGATYTALNVAESTDGIWSAQCIVDV